MGHSDFIAFSWGRSPGSDGDFRRSMIAYDFGAEHESISR
jgi:hypothetical protein